MVCGKHETTSQLFGSLRMSVPQLTRVLSPSQQSDSVQPARQPIKCANLRHKQPESFATFIRLLRPTIKSRQRPLFSCVSVVFLLPA